VVGHSDNALNDCGIVAIRAELLDKRAVDLDLVYRQAFEIAETGKSGAEIIESNAHSQSLEPVQCVDRLFSVMQQKRFGDLQFQLLTTESVLLQMVWTN